MLIRELTLKDKETYNQVVTSVTQSWAWGDFREKTGVKVVRLGGFNESNLVNGLSVFFHTVPYFGVNIGYIPRGLINSEQWLSAIITVAKKNNALFVKIDPDLVTGDFLEKQGSQFNLVPSKSILPKNTFFLDLTKPEEELLTKMAEKTRYNIRLGQKHGVVVKEGGLRELEIFIRILEETEKRQGFYSHYADYYRKLWESLSNDGLCYLLIAYDNNIPLSAIMLFKFKDTLYYPYGGSSVINREKMANYVIHWEAIKLGKKLGCKVYDMWGAFKETATETDPWFGIYRFKKGFGGSLVTFPTTMDLVIDERGYKLYLMAEKIRWWGLKTKRELASRLTGLVNKSS